MAITTLKDLASSAGHGELWAVPPKPRAADYHAASNTRRMVKIAAGKQPITSMLQSSGETLRDRSRESVRNNPWAANGIERWVSNAVGTGITPKSRYPDKDVRKLIQKCWLRWTDQADPNGLTDYYGLQALAYRTTIIAGECLGRLRFRRPEDTDRLQMRLIVPLQLQLIQPDHLPFTKNEELKAANGQKSGTIRWGVEFDLLEKPVAYWVYRSHPNDYSAPGADRSLARITADQILHVFRQLEPGQWRGEPWLAKVLTRLYDLDTYEDAARQRGLMAALYSFWLKKTDGTRPGPLSENPGSTNGQTAETDIEPGTGTVLLPGEDMGFNDPPDDPNYEPATKDLKRGIAAGLGLSEFQLTGDYSDYNFSSSRGAILEFRRLCEQIQNQMFVFQFCRPVWKAWIEQAIMFGPLAEFRAAYLKDPWPFLDVEWRTPKWTWVDPLKDVQAEVVLNRAGYKARSQSIKDLGEDAEDVDEQIAEDNERADGYGHKFDSDPRNTDAAGKRIDATVDEPAVVPTGGKKR